jgi:hypothetical protein
VIRRLIVVVIAALAGDRGGAPLAAQSRQTQGPAVVEGRALRRDRAPLPFARVRLRNLADDAAGDRLTADHLGRFALPIRTAGRYQVEIIDDTGRMRGASEALTVDPERSALTSATVSACAPWTDALFGNVRLSLNTPGALKPGATALVAGQTVKPDRTPITSASVRLRSLPDGRPVAYAAVDVMGRFAFANLDEGRYVVEISSTRGRTLAASEALEVEAGGRALTSVTPESCTPWVAAWIVAAGAVGAGAAVVSVIDNPASPER